MADAIKGKEFYLVAKTKVFARHCGNWAREYALAIIRNLLL
jgi:hypothetical protein